MSSYLYNTKNPELIEKVKAFLPNIEEIDKLETFLKIMADATRLRLLLVLYGREMCVSDLCNILNMSRSAISHQLTILRLAKIIERKKIGKSVFYALADEHVSTILNMALKHSQEKI